ncbi:MAG TPA: hypothetical protein VI756_17415 [Blastocatellia bacterium]
MTRKAEQFRQHAADCVKLAAAATDHQARTALMHMASAWLRLIEWHEKLAEPEGDEER